MYSSKKFTVHLDSKDGKGFWSKDIDLDDRPFDRDLLDIDYFTFNVDRALFRQSPSHITLFIKVARNFHYPTNEELKKYGWFYMEHKPIKES